MVVEPQARNADSTKPLGNDPLEFAAAEFFHTPGADEKNRSIFLGITQGWMKNADTTIKRNWLRFHTACSL